jgi:hypothetical protein
MHSSSSKPSSGPSYQPSSALEPMLYSENITTSAADTGNGTSTTTSANSSTHANNSTVCESGLWHVSDDFSKCTNSFGYPPEWDREELSKIYLHESLSNCCHQFFYAHGNECKHEDICASEDDNSPKCGDWHPDTQNQNGCSNSIDYPKEWKGNDAIFHNSSEACCASFFADRECAVRDVCGGEIDIVTSVAPGTNESITTTKPGNEETKLDSETTLAPTGNENDTTLVPILTTETPVSTTDSQKVTTPFVVTDPTSTAAPLTPTETTVCESTKWHLSNDASHCTNSLDYHKSWDTPALSGAYLFENLESCCNKFFGGSYDLCAPVDVCPSGCQSGLWHLSTDFLTCTNSFDYPETWNTPTLKEIYLHETWNGCCDNFFGGDYERCAPDDICSVTTPTMASEAIPTTVDSSHTTSAPIVTQTLTTPLSESTPSATTTLNTTTELTCTSSNWHPEPVNSDGCTNSLEYPTEWEGVSSLFFDTVEECCEYFRGDEHCEVYRVCKEEPQPKINETALTCTSFTWYPDMINKDGCTNSLNVSKELLEQPHLAFGSSQECCQTLLKDKPCKVYHACEEGTSTSTPSTSPTILIFSCTNNKWHPDMVNRDGCSNSLDWPDTWDDKYFFPNSTSCCDFFFPGGDKDCSVYQVCEDRASNSTVP